MTLRPPRRSAPAPGTARARLAALALLLAAPLPACLDPPPGLSTPLTFCRETARIECRAFYECFDESGLAEAQAQWGQQWTGRADCEAQRLAACEPDPRVCQPGETFQEQHATACLSARQALTCNDWRDPRRRLPRACVRCEMITPTECVDQTLSYCTTGF